MFREFVHKAFSFCLAIIVVISTISIPIEKHFCGNKLIDVALFAKAEKCDMATIEQPCSNKKSSSCCKDISEFIVGQDKLYANSQIDFKFNTEYYSLSAVFFHLNKNIDITQQFIPFKEYSPPDLVPDILVLEQVFII